MHSKFIFLVMAMSSVLLTSATIRAEDKKVCMKDGKELKTEGKNAKEKETDCQKNGGTWEKKEASAGSSGGW